MKVLMREKITIGQGKVALCFPLCVLLLGLVLTHSLHYYESISLGSSWLMLFCCTLVMFSNGVTFNRIRWPLAFLLLSMLIATFCRGESQYVIENLIMISAIFLILNFNSKGYDIFAESSIIVGIVTLAVYLQTYFSTGGSYIGNRWPLQIITIGIIAESLLIEKGRSSFSQVLLGILLILIAFFAQSRTSLVGACTAFLWCGYIASRKN